MSVSFEWDEDKNLSNFKKHGVWFEEAKTIWEDEDTIELFDLLHSINEDRFIRIGRSLGIKSRILIVVYCERNEGEIIRIISARETTSYELEKYEKRI